MAKNEVDERLELKTLSKFRGKKLQLQDWG
jgi:hypothetical protein